MILTHPPDLKCVCLVAWLLQNSPTFELFLQNVTEKVHSNTFEKSFYYH